MVQMLVCGLGVSDVHLFGNADTGAGQMASGGGGGTTTISCSSSSICKLHLRMCLHVFGVVQQNWKLAVDARFKNQGFEIVIFVLGGLGV
jgi:hypothetical protein